MRALESGQNIDLISERITAKRLERKSIERDLAVELKKSVTLTEPEIRFFLTALKSGDINDLKYRRTLIKILVNSVYLYDDRMTIVFNAGDEPVVVDDILLDEIEESCEDAKSLYSARFGSPKTPPPERAVAFLHAGDSNGKMPQPGGLWLAAGWTAVTPIFFLRKNANERRKVRHHNESRYTASIRSAVSLSLGLQESSRFSISDCWKLAVVFSSVNTWSGVI